MTGKKRKKEKKANEITVHIEQTKKYGNFYTFTQQVLQHFHKTFIFSHGWSQSHILLFYFNL